MIGEYIVQITKVKDGVDFRIVNTKNSKVSRFISTKLSTENGKYFQYLFNNSIKKTQ
jgi:NMD protein affecting ribosome stability and mRNA decay